MTYSSRTHVAPGDLGTAADQNQGMDNEDYLKSEHDLATPTDLNAGWRKAADTWVYVSATSFKITGQDRTSIYQKGTRIRWKDGGSYKYAVVVLSAFSTDSTVTFTGGSDYSMANATITDNYYSYEASPQGYPDFFNFTPSFTGFSAAPTGVYRFSVIGHICFITAFDSADGTSNSTAKTFVLPITASNNSLYIGVLIPVYRNSSADGKDARTYVLPGSATLNVFTANWGAWTNSGACRLFGSTNPSVGVEFFYEI